MSRWVKLSGNLLIPDYHPPRSLPDQCSWYIQYPHPMSKTVDRSDILAIVAILVSLGAIFVSVRQTSILKEQQLIMAQQQEIMGSQLEGSVWPHLVTNVNVTDNQGTRTVEYSVTNKGVGPAKIKRFEFTLGDSHIRDVSDLSQYVIGLKDFVRLAGISISIPSEAVLAPNETRQVYRISYVHSEMDSLEYTALVDQELICYCSIYDNCYGDCKEPSPAEPEQARD